VPRTLEAFYIHLLARKVAPAWIALAVLGLFGAFLVQAFSHKVGHAEGGRVIRRRLTARSGGRYVVREKLAPESKMGELMTVEVGQSRNRSRGGTGGWPVHPKRASALERHNAKLARPTRRRRRALCLDIGRYVSASFTGRARHLQAPPPRGTYAKSL
jgi:hypothetical protein